MSIESRRHQYGTVFGHWQIGELLGSSKNGQTAVFRLQHKESSQEESAVKVITLIEEHGKLSEFSPRRRAEYEAELEKRKQHALNEVQIMYALKGYTNIVSYEDRVTEHWTEDNSFGCDLLIRMELLRDLRKIIDTGQIFSEAEIIKIGKDICTALILCHEEEDPIIHRDIKPENIFVNARGDYKLGDFGISRILDRCHGTTATTAIGTPEYYAPEQERKGYDERVDIYSLGLVLYELSNRNRRPFMESTYDNGGKANLLRLSGTKFPPPCDASDDFAKVILKACAFKANSRYRTAKEMLEALEQLSITPHSRTFKPAKTPTRSASRSYETIPSNASPGNGNSFATVAATPSTEGNISDTGNGNAEWEMGWRYQCGHGVSKDLNIAFSWYEKSAERGNHYGMTSLANCFLYGRGTKKNATSAISWYKKAVAAGSVISLRLLGYCYATGSGVSQDVIKAMDYYLKAMGKNDVEAAVQYEIVLTSASKKKRDMLSAHGHKLENISKQHAAEIEKRKKYRQARKKEKQKTVLCIAGLGLPLIALIAGCIMWFVSIPIWLNIAILAATGIISVLLFLLGVDDLGEDLPEKLLIIGIGAIIVPLATAIVVALLEGVLWGGKWIFSFFS